MNKPLRHILVPPVVFDLLWAAGWTAIMYGSTGERETAIAGFGFFLLLGLPVGILLAQQLLIRVDPEVMVRHYEILAGMHALKREPAQPIQVTSVIQAPGQTQVDYFHGLTAEEWRRCATSITAADNFTVATVGQAQRPKLIPLMQGAGFIQAMGDGKYELTDNGRRFWYKLAARPPHLWDVPPKNIQILSTAGIYT